MMYNFWEMMCDRWTDRKSDTQRWVPQLIITPSLYWGNLIWKIAKKMFLNLCGDTPLWGEFKLYGGVIFIIILSFIQKQSTPRKVKFFFYKFLQEMWIHQELLLADMVKFAKKFLWKSSLFVLTVTSVLEKVFC